MVTGLLGGRPVRHLNHFVLIVDLKDLVRNFVVVWTAFILQAVDEIKNGLNLWHVARRAHPESSVRIFKAARLDVFHLIYCVVPLFAPLQFFIQKIEHCEIKGPKVVTPRKINIVVRI